ncbi:hypothetical protein [Streptomyces flavofungini]|uniref:Uncharacterized protein n=1 Tax=Streptomyces flavofungini TaxID=68200 RepID=A0ABS0XED3_9ACTN|nr:hypothetical protein [Streptomyces flavofungini]MBJ3811279.1 hypothetical protein [Streptomyces flavofungini]GHC66400.1 hypothetical protein GCM10010349_39000 [Streptomyces flavofungini]
MTPKSPTTRASHLALLVALLFGIVAMHTLGHPREHGASAERASAAGQTGVADGGGHAREGSGATHAREAKDASPADVSPADVSPAAMDASAMGPTDMSRMDMGPTSLSPSPLSPTPLSPTDMSPTDMRHAATGPTSIGPEAGDATDGHGSGMDPLSVCLAVLGAALTLALLHAAVRHRPLGSPVPAPGLARLLDALRPNPPPPRTLLTRLSVLRV